jgi:hypothetical protein
VSATFVAQYPGSCDDCGGSIKDTECLFNQAGELVHVRCPDSELEPPKGAPLCQSCFTYHNGECA